MTLKIIIIIAFLIIGLANAGLAFAITTKTDKPAKSKIANQTLIDAARRLKEKKIKAAELKIKKQKLIKDLEKITAEYQEAYNHLVIISKRLKSSKINLDQASTDFTIEQDNLNKRVSEIYKNRQDTLLLELMLSIESFQDIVSNFKYFNLVTSQDANMVKKTGDLKDNVELQYEELQKIKQEQETTLKDLKDKKDAIERNLETQNIISTLLNNDIINMQSVTYQQGNLKISIVFPVSGPHSYTDDFGAPRIGHTHQGNDIFASKGTPCVATTDGYIGNLSPVEKGLGGIYLWIYGNDGIRYYYAHLTKIADNITLGTTVKAGQVVGYVGNTGDARTTPYHLHFQIDISSGPIDPYPFLRAADPNLW
jgi:murein DD-endopeptidase MepM/ murein hydrolase activator NlpD